VFSQENSALFQCCQLFTKLFGQINQKIRPLAKKIGPLQNLLKNEYITVFYTLFLSAREQEIKDIRRWSVLLCRYFKVFYMKKHLQKSSAPFRPILAYYRKIRPPIFPAAQIFVGPLLSSAAEISAPWQHWLAATLASLNTIHLDPLPLYPLPLFLYL
jgi:hypothetical protein